MTDEPRWEATSGKGIVPKWVSEIGLFGAKTYHADPQGRADAGIRRETMR